MAISIVKYTNTEFPFSEIKRDTIVKHETNYINWRNPLMTQEKEHEQAILSAINLIKNKYRKREKEHKMTIGKRELCCGKCLRTSFCSFVSFLFIVCIHYIIIWNRTLRLLLFCGEFVAVILYFKFIF